MRLPLSSNTSRAAAPSSRQPITGRELQRLLYGKSNRERGEIAAYLKRTKRSVKRLSLTQFSRLCDVHAGRTSTALGNDGKRGPRDKTIDKVVRRFVVAALMRGLDRATAPNGNGANGSRAA